MSYHQMEQFQQYFLQHAQCFVVAMYALYYISRAADQLIFLREAKFQRWGAWHHCIRTTLCLCINKCLYTGFLVIRHTNMLVQLVNWAIFPKRDATRGLQDLGRSITSFVSWYFLTILLTVEWWWPTWRYRRDITASLISNLPSNCICELWETH